MSWISITCHRCQERFQMTEETYTALKRSGNTFYCPWGHTAVFIQGPTEAEKLRLERDRLQQRIAQKDDEIRWQREQREAAERRVSATRGVVTKLKKRAAAGVCPCCNRQFVNLQRHMASKHAGFVAEEILPDGATVQ